MLDGPLGSRVFAIAVCPTNGDVWIATEAGLSRYRELKTSGHWDYYTRAEGLPSDQASCLAFDKAGNLYVGTQCDGIAIGRAADGYAKWSTVSGPLKLQNASEGKGLPTCLVNAVYIARNGVVYAGTNCGLACSKDSGKTWIYTRGADWKDKIRGMYNAPPVNED